MFAAMLAAACQIDLKRIIAYGSISHMGLVTFCIFLNNSLGLKASFIMMIGHGFVSSALFILVGGLYERFHTRNLRYFGGLYRALPQWGLFFLLFSLFDIGIPTSPSFVAELLGVISVTQVSLILTILFIIPVIIGVGVVLLVLTRILYGDSELNYFNRTRTAVGNIL